MINMESLGNKVMKKYVVYLTHYTGDKLPPWYIGSSFEEKVLNGYNGTILSKKWKEIYKQEQKENKHLFKTKIISYHNSHKAALAEELRLQKSHNVVKNAKYFNESYAQINGCFGRDVSGKLNPMYGEKHIDETKQKISNYERTEETRKKLSDSRKGKSSGMKNKKHTEETKKKMSESTNHHGENNPFYGKTHTVETRKKISTSNIGRKDSDETRKKKSESKKGNKHPMYGVKREQKHCEHCQRQIDVANFTRWHGDNCKMKDMRCEMLTIGEFNDGTDEEYIDTSKPKEYTSMEEAMSDLDGFV